MNDILVYKYGENFDDLQVVMSFVQGDDQKDRLVYSNVDPVSGQRDDFNTGLKYYQIKAVDEKPRLLRMPIDLPKDLAGQSMTQYFEYL